MKIRLDDLVEFTGKNKLQVLGTYYDTCCWEDSCTAADLQLRLLFDKVCAESSDLKATCTILEELESKVRHMQQAHYNIVRDLEYRIRFLLTGEAKDKLQNGTDLPPDVIDAYLRKRKLQALASL